MDSTSNFYKPFKSTKEHFRIQYSYLQTTHNSEMTMFKKWSKSEISQRTAVMKVFNFWQNFNSTSNFQKWFKTTRKHFRISFWHLQFTNKSEMTMLKKCSKPEISLRTAVMKIFNFWQNFDSTSNFQKWLKKTKKNSLEYHFDTCNSLSSQNDNDQKVVKIWNFAKDRGH